MPLHSVVFATHGYFDLPYVTPTGCPLVQIYETDSEMDSTQLSESLDPMPLVFRIAFKYLSSNCSSIAVEEIVDMLAGIDLSPLNSRLQLLHALYTPYRVQ
ncbi:hypothetical protein EC988_001325 [Linderina pennispora]|nr:hypothetical protein EC988_001325 [Linderina pennispora]